jgi:hypothetical protein
VNEQSIILCSHAKKACDIMINHLYSFVTTNCALRRRSAPKKKQYVGPTPTEIIHKARIIPLEQDNNQHTAKPTQHHHSKLISSATSRRL